MTRIAVIFAALLAVGVAACGSEATDPPPESEATDAPSEGASGDSPPFSTAGWETDFSNHSVPLGEFVGGGPPKDGIPSIDRPVFISGREAERFLDPGEPVEFGTTGMLRNSDLVMYDRSTESWWQQITAEAVVGERTGAELDVLPSQILSWGELRRLHPGAGVLSRDTGFDRAYGSSPYGGYDRDPQSRPFLLEGEPDRSLPPKERVAAITSAQSAVVYPFSRLRRDAPINDELDGEPIVVFFA